MILMKTAIHLNDWRYRSLYRWNHSSLAKELILYGAQYSQRNNEDKTPDDLTTVSYTIIS